MDDITDILDNGIAAKRAGNYDLALKHYSQASSISPGDSRIYNNTFRIHFGLEKYENAIRNLLVICSFNRIDRLIERDLLNPDSRALFNEFRGRFKSPTILYKKGIFSSVRFEPELIWNAIEMDSLLNDLILRADNLTYYIGHSYIGMFPSIMKTHDIPLDGFRNLTKALLGNPIGNDLREHKTAGLFLCLGFIFAHMNINQSLRTKEEVVNYYLNPENQLDWDVHLYKDFLQGRHKKSSEKKLVESPNMENTPTKTSSDIVKVFQESEFTKLVQRTQATFKLPNEDDEHTYLLVIIPSSESDTGIGVKSDNIPQHWELTDERNINGKPYSVFQMWGAVPLLNLGGDYDAQQSMIPHEGKKIAVPKSEVLSIVSYLNRASPHDFSYQNLKMANVLKDSIR